jgi:ankyrin repeat protein
MSSPQDPSTGASRALPARANLTHLRNEAKQRLREMRRTGPGAKLADAQQVTARRYGFASWRKLKAYVDALHDCGERLLGAVRAGDTQTMRAVLDRHPALVNATTDLNPRIRPSDALAMRLIHLAIAENQFEAAKLLVERGADLNVRNADGRLPLHDCFELGRDAFRDLLLNAGAEPDVCAAAAYGMHQRLREILKGDPASANDLQTGISPMGWSIYGQQPESMQILIEHGAILNRPPYDAAAWGAAAHVANTEMARLLLEHGADPNCRDENSNTPLHLAIRSRIVRNPSAFIEVLLASGADPTITNYDGRTPLEEAMIQSGKMAETYFPARPVARKELDRAIELLRRAVARSEPA